MTTPICTTITRDPRATPAALAVVIAATVADVECRAAAIADMEERLCLDLAKQRLGMATSSIGMRTSQEQLAAETMNLANTRRILSGLRAIEAASKAQPAGSMERRRGGKVVFDKALGQMVAAKA
ncbi:MAG: hypothetical protein M0P95_13830 [Sulfuritalea sp.]|jgi:nicotinate-nucleotide pyrophosphorylase|nr:hypothetical protein [Sulfuritalea sp.]